MISKTSKKPKSKQPTVISLFTCGMGLDIGFEKAGFSTVYANDITKFACNTIRKNRPDVHCDEGDITSIASKDILRRSGHRNVDVVIGGPPCQSFSPAGMRRGLDDKRGMALLEFIRIIKDVRPKFFVFENVPGLRSAAKTHISFYDRKSTDAKKLSKDKQYGSLFAEILKEFEKINGYKFEWNILNAADYGVPQKRKRLILIGSRVADPVTIFEAIKRQAKYGDPVKTKESRKKPWVTLRSALRGINDNEECAQFPKWGKYLRYVPPGGCWVDLPKNVKSKAMRGAADSSDPKKIGKQGGRRGFYRRLSWDAPAPTLLTSPTQLGSCMCHPDELRPLSVNEYSRIQGFPSTWKFVGSTSQKYRMIGEAVPVQLALVIAKTIKLLIDNRGI